MATATTGTTTLRNGTFQALSLGLAFVVLVLGVTGAVVSRTVDPPLSWLFTGAVLALALLGVGWYGLGARYALRVDHKTARITGKVRTRRLALADIAGFEPDRSKLRAFRLSGAMLVVCTSDGRRVRARAVLPNAADEQQRVIDLLNRRLPKPAGRAAGAADEAEPPGADGS